MRSFTSQEEAAFLSTSRRMYHKVQIEDPSGAWVDYTTDGGSSVDWVDRWKIRSTVEEPVAGLEVELFREIDGSSLAPYLSPGSEAIKAGRGIRVYVAATNAGDPTPSDGEYWLLFDGFIDGWSAGERAETISLTCRDRLGLLADVWTIAGNTYGSAAGVDIRTVTQAIASERTSEILNWLADPGFVILEYTQRRQSMLDAIMANVDLIGWLMRYRWSDVSNGYRIEVFEPDRSSPAVLWTVTPDDYFELPLFAEDSDDIRNEGVGVWSGGTVTATDDVSIAEYGRVKTIVLDASQDAQITTEARMTTLISAVVADLSQPLAQAKAILPLVPWVQVNDFYSFTANAALFAQAQNMAVVSFEHEYGPDGGSSTLELRGQPSGGVTRWDAIRDRLEDDQATPAAPDPPALDAGDIEFRYTVVSGSGGLAQAGTAAGSLGGWISTTEVSTAVNGLFRAVSNTEALSGITLYRSVAVLNNSGLPATLPWEAVIAYLQDAPSDGAAWAVGIDPLGVYDAATYYAAVSADETTAPSGVTFYTHDDAQDSPQVGGFDIQDGEAIVLHLRLTVAPWSGAGFVTDDLLIVTDQVPYASGSP